VQQEQERAVVDPWQARPKRPSRSEADMAALTAQ
jgi:hypothetical protein